MSTSALAAAFDVPDLIRRLPGWVVWRRQPHRTKPGKFLKIPYYCGTGRRRGRDENSKKIPNGSPEDRAQLVDFDAALAVYQQGGWDGVGFAPMPDWHLTIMDFDKCVNGKINENVHAIVLGTYAEYSPSNTGIRALFRGDLPNFKDIATEDKFGVEVFHDSGFVTITGHTLESCRMLDAENIVAEVSPELITLVNERMALRGAEQTGPLSEEARLKFKFALQGATEKTIEDLRGAVQGGFLDEEAKGYETWIKGGHAIKSLELAGFPSEAWDLWHLFSARSEDYDPDESDAKWDSFSPYRITFKTIFGWAQRNGWKNPESAAAKKQGDAEVYALLEDRSDIGNANLLIKLTEGSLRYVWEWKHWIWWDGARWIDDKSGAYAMAGAKLVAQHYHKKAEELKHQAADEALSKEERKRILAAAESIEKWAGHCRNKKAIDPMMAMAARDERVVMSAADLDRDPWLFGVDNGTIDLRTGQLREASRDEFVTQRSPIAFDPTAKAPRWVQFIAEITGRAKSVDYDAETGAPIQKSVGQFDPRPALADYQQRALGYCLTGSVAEQKVFIFYGDGSNGKNVLLDIVQDIMGDYCRTIDPKFLMSGDYLANPESPSPVAASLAGARLAISSESKDGQKLDIALIKRHSGDGFLTARGMNQNTFRFAITHKLLLMTNHRPALEHIDFATQGRLHLVPFERKWNRPGVANPDPALPTGDKGLMQKLKAEAPGILAWLVQGAARYFRLAQDGLTPPQEVAETTREYFAEQDPVGRWLEGFDLCDPRLGATATDLFSRFEGWRMKDEAGSGWAPRSAKAFGKALAEHGVRFKKKETGMHYGINQKTKNLTDDGS